MCGVGRGKLRHWRQALSVEIPCQPLPSFMNLGKLLSLSGSLSIREMKIVVHTLGILNNSHKRAYAPATTFITSVTHPLSGAKILGSLQA